MTRSKRINESWSGGTPDTDRKGITDLLVSPEVIEDIRGMAYNPINTRGGVTQPNGQDTGTWGVTAPDSIRAGLFNDSGEMQNFFGVNIMEVYQLGAGEQFTQIYRTLGGFAGGARTDLVIALNRNRSSLYRAVSVTSESGSEFNLLADDQYSVRQKKIGYYGSLEEGRMVLDNRAILGVNV